MNLHKWTLLIKTLFISLHHSRMHASFWISLLIASGLYKLIKLSLNCALFTYRLFILLLSCVHDYLFFFVDPTTWCLFFFLLARNYSLSPLTKPNHHDFSSRRDVGQSALEHAAATATTGPPKLGGPMRSHSLNRPKTGPEGILSLGACSRFW